MFSHRRSLRLLFRGLVLSLAFASVARAEEELRGVALVIGESEYASLTPLPNPGNDAGVVADMLDRLGFEVAERKNRNAAQLRRDLERFVEDAAEADVAVVYYSGHGIEAGGENWLVPVDADPSSLETGAKLVALSPVMDRLAEAVPLTLFFLDACRTSPFAAGAALKLDGGEFPVAAAGLYLSRSAVALTDGKEGARQTVGTIIGFSAEPGAVAFDGPAGGTSYYAAALSRHLGASEALEFGAVMRLVTEEVYLKSSGRQRPWVNESLVRLLYFGGSDAALSEDEELILGERRQLLLTITELDPAIRKQVETTAGAEGVAMDALYGLLGSLGADTPRDPVQLADVLKAQVEALQRQLDEATGWQAEDPEVARFLTLADEAIAEGALKAARHFADAALARVRDRRIAREAIREDLKIADLEDARVTAATADTYALDGDHLGAAGLYAEAFGLAELWDAAVAADHKFAEARALYEHGRLKGDNAALIRAIDIYRGVLPMVDRRADPAKWAETQNNLGIALWALGEREGDTARLEEAITAYRAALEEQTRDRVPLEWAETQNNLGIVLWTLGEREGDTARLEEAIATYRAALEEWTRDRVPLAWAMTQNNLGNALWALGKREEDMARLEEAIAAYRAALEEQTRARVPLEWAVTQSNLGNALQILGKWEGDTERLEEAIAAYRAALEEQTRDRVPLDWAMTQNNLGNALSTLGELEGDTAWLEEAIAVYHAALEEQTRDRVPLDWAMTQYNLGFALDILAKLQPYPDRTVSWRDAMEAWRNAQSVYSREATPAIWASLQNSISYALVLIGETTGEEGAFVEAVAGLRAAAAVQAELAIPELSYTQDSLCRALLDLGRVRSDRALLTEARDLCLAALDGEATLGGVWPVDGTRENLEAIDRALAELE